MTKKMRVGIQGIKTSFHDIAAKKYFKEREIQIVECASFIGLCQALRLGEIDCAVMAIENAIAGSILQNYALLSEYGFKITGEVTIPIRMNLMVNPGVLIEDINEIHSHPVAIQQCEKYLRKFENVQVVAKQDTARTALEIKNKKQLDTAAIANELTAREFGLEILAKDIQTHKQNYTRFLVLSSNIDVAEDNNKASLEFELKHEIGSLEYILNVFRLRGINLTKIQSLPVIGKPNKYKFYVDVEFGDKYEYNKTIHQIKEHVDNLVIMGEYKNGLNN